MKPFLAVLVALVVTATGYTPFTPPAPPQIIKSSQSRRTFIELASATVFATTLVAPKSASASDDSIIPVYFGAGCFWHVQHEFVEAEIKFLKRTEKQLTARAGYAGGMKLGKDGRVCYHNLGGKDEYGKMGHCEVVGLSIPKSR